MPNVRLAEPTNNAAMDAVIARINVGGTGAIQFYDGVQPINPNSIITDQNLLFVLGFLSPAFIPSADGITDANTITSTIAIFTSNATWARLIDGNGDKIFDCDVGTVGTTIILDTTVIEVDDLHGLASFRLIHPDGA